MFGWDNDVESIFGVIGGFQFFQRLNHSIVWGISLVMQLFTNNVYNNQNSENS